MPPEALLGPFALLVAAVVTVGILWREHMADVARDRLDLDRERDRGDRLQGLLDLALRNNSDSIAAWSKRNEQDAARQRRGDGRP